MSAPRLTPVQSLDAFSVGDHVAWTNQGVRMTGTVKRVNGKSLSVMRSDLHALGQKWRVGPSACSKVAS